MLATCLDGFPIFKQQKSEQWKNSNISEYKSIWIQIAQVKKTEGEEGPGQQIVLFPAIPVFSAVRVAIAFAGGTKVGIYESTFRDSFAIALSVDKFCFPRGNLFSKSWINFKFIATAGRLVE